MATTKEKEKEQSERLKNLRKELEEKLEEQLLPVLENEKTSIEVQRVDENQTLEPLQRKRVVEALLFASTKPLTPSGIRRVLKSLTVKEIEEIIQQLAAEYQGEGRSFEILQIAGGYEIATKKEYAPWILKIELQKKAKQVTQSALETLAILAYKQPITRAEIEDLRGVDVCGVMSTLLERGLIKIVGRKEVPGRPFLYGTTEKFLEHFGLKSIANLPSLEEIRKMVEASVRKEDLIGTSKIVPVTEPGKAGKVQAGADEEKSEEAEGGLSKILSKDDLDAEEEIKIDELSKEEAESAEEETRPAPEIEDDPTDHEGNGLEPDTQQN